MDSRHTKDDRALEAGYPTALEEKSSMRTEETREPQPPRFVVIQKMPSPRHLLVTLALCFLFTFGLAHALSPKAWHRGSCHEKSSSESQQQQQEQVVDASRFTNMLDAVSPDSLHDLLHRYLPERYQHGVFSSDHSALEAVHRDDAPLATSLAQLAKRQDTNSTSVPTTSPTSSAPTTTSHTSTTVTTPTSSAPTSTSASSVPSSTSAPPTSSSSSSSSRPPSSSVTSSEPTSSSSESRTSPPRTSKPTTSTYTSTLPNGAATTVVETSYVGVDDPNQTTSTKPSGSLQTNAAVARNRGHLVEAAVGVIVGGALLI